MEAVGLNQLHALDSISDDLPLPVDANPDYVAYQTRR